MVCLIQCAWCDGSQLAQSNIKELRKFTNYSAPDLKCEFLTASSVIVLSTYLHDAIKEAKAKGKMKIFVVVSALVCIADQKGKWIYMYTEPQK